MIPDIEGLPPSPQSPSEWAAWRDQVLAHRLKVLAETNHPDPAVRQAARARELVLIERSSAYLANVYGGIYEARRELEVDDLTPIVIPYIMYPFQIEVWHELDQALTRRGPEGDVAIIKARDMGLSNTVAFWVARNWLVRKVFQARMLSRREDLVDQTGNPDSLFWKIETFLMGLPDWIMQHFAPGFDWKQHRLQMRFINPRTMNVIAGESTQANAGRGGRATVIVYDEACFMPDLGAIWTAGRASTNHRILISTVSVSEGTACYDIVHGENGYERPRVLHVPWNAHPEHDLEWLARERARDTEEGFRREVLMDWDAGTGEWVYPEIRSVYPDPGITYEPGAGDFYVSIDDGFDDDFAMVFIQVIDRTGRIRVLDGYTNSHKPVDFYGSILRSKPLSHFTYTDRELRLMEWLRQMPPFTVTGDPHVRQTEQVSGMSVYDRLLSEWGIVVVTDPVKRTPKDLRTALSALIPMMDFADTQGAREVLSALKNYRFRSVSPGRELAHEQREPVHSKHSHYATALGYWAVNYQYFSMARSDSIRYVGVRSQ